jgi:cysteine-rich repeat protein
MSYIEAMFRHAAVALGLLVASAWSCNFDWDRYDPRGQLVVIGASGGGTSASGVGGSGGATGTGGMASTCGDGMIDPSEQCDDGNTAGGDGCDVGCQVECSTLLDPQTGHCYAVLDATPATWADARSQCGQLGAGYDLAAISSQAELDWLSAQPSIAALLIDDDNTAVMWLGGTDTASEGTWLWSNGEPFFDAWVVGEPSNDGAGGGPGEDCNVYLRRATMFGYDDRPCDITYPMLCERAPAGAIP